MKNRWALGVGRRAASLLLGVVLVGACQQQNAASRGEDSARTAERSPAAQEVGSAEISRPTPDAQRPTVVFAGTSLTAGLGLEPDSAYPAMIGRRVQAAGLPYAVVNAGVSGETSAGLRARLGWLLRRPMAVLVIETGANDGLRGLPVAEIRANIQAVIDSVRRVQPATRILLVQMEAPPNFGPAYTRGFHALYGEVARANGITLLPFLLDRVAGHAELNQADGIHPNLTGERMVADNVWRVLEPVLRAGAGAAAAPAR